MPPLRTNSKADALAVAVGKVIRVLRTRKQLSGAKFARLVGVSQQSVNGWETGTRIPSLPAMYLISAAVGVSVPELIRLSEVGLRILEQKEQGSDGKPGTDGVTRYTDRLRADASKTRERARGAARDRRGTEPD